MAVSHAKSNTVADWTGTVTVGNSTGGTQTIAATDLVRPGDWNSAHNQYYTLSGNTLGSSTASGTNVVFAGSGGISLQGSNDTIVISASPDVVHSLHMPYGLNSAGFSQIGQNSIYVAPFQGDGIFSFNRANHLFSVSQSSSSNSSYAIALTMDVGIYSRNGSTLSLFTSGQGTAVWTVTSNNTTANQAGLRMMSGALNASLSDGDWWYAVRSSTATTGANWATISNARLSWASVLSGSLAAAANATAGIMPGLGVFSTTSNALPSSMGFSAITGTGGSAQPPIIVFENSRP